jgi:hypothetical protein
VCFIQFSNTWIKKLNLELKFKKTKMPVNCMNSAFSDRLRGGITSRRIAVLCEQDRIAGVVKKGKTWLIPYDSEKPEDARKNNHSK